MMSRRDILRTGGSIGLGAVSISGTAASDDDFSTQRGRRLEVIHDSIVGDATEYTVSVCRNQGTGEMDGIILATKTEGKHAKSLAATSESSVGLYGIRDDILNSIEEEFFKDDSHMEGSNWEDRSYEDLWNFLVDSEDQLRAQDESIWDEIVGEISDGIKESINQLGLYHIESPEGTPCSATYAGGPHRQLGASVDYADDLNALGSASIGAVVGALLILPAVTFRNNSPHRGGEYLYELTAGSMTSVVSGPGGVVGGLSGAVAGFAASNMKDTSSLTTVLRDYDSCTCLLGRCFCNPKLEPLVSGTWMDENENLLTIPSVDPYALHLANMVSGGVYTGYRSIYYPEW